MRWYRLVADLESQLDALVGAEVSAEVAERTRIEMSAIHLADRLRAAEDHPIEVHCACGVMAGRLSASGPGWLLLTEASGQEVLVSTTAMLGVTGLGRAATPPDATVAARLTLRHALRGIARDRQPVHLGLVDGSTRSGTIDRVGADFLDLAEHPPGEWRRPAAVLRMTAVPLSAVALVRS